MKKSIKGNQMKGFTLVELLAVIVILAIILVIAVPKVMSVIEDAKKATLESTAKMIASQAEKQKVQNQVLGQQKEITCDDVAKINNNDYESCSIEFEDNTAKVTIIGSGKFEGLNVCNGTKIEATGVDVHCKEVCTSNEVLTEIKQIVIKNKSTCNTYIGDILVSSGMQSSLGFIEPLCNGEVVEGMNTGEAINYLINMGLVTKEELINNNVIEETREKYCKPNLPEKASKYISRIYNDPSSGLIEPIIKYTTSDNKEKKLNTGIRYTGVNPNNKVYYNCDDTDTTGVSYGSNNYDYASSCEVWRIIGVFNVQDGSGNIEKRVKIINTNSTFEASWDSSDRSINNGYGINQWGESTYENGTPYEGADLMRLLNGYYIGKSGSSCTYCNDFNQETCNQTCTDESLKSANMKVLTNTAKGMIKNALWDTYAVGDVNVSSEIYLMEKGISTQYTGKSLCEGSGSSFCNDSVTRTTSWTGLVGLTSLYDVNIANGWLYCQQGSESCTWLITASIQHAHILNTPAYDGWTSNIAMEQDFVFPSVYLKSNVQIIDGNGNTEPYKLAM